MKNPLRSLRVAVCTLALCALFPTSARAQKVLLLHADDPTWADDVRTKLVSTGVLTQVDVLDVRAADSTPTLNALLAYDAVLTWSDWAYGSDTALGDVLADYVDRGHGVVQALFGLVQGPQGLAGRWRTGGYDLFSGGSLGMGAGLSLTTLQAQHPILEHVVRFDGGAVSYHNAGLTVSPCGEVVASWSNGEPLVVACSVPQGGRRVGLNFFPPSSDMDESLWAAGTDGALLMANALRFAAVLTAPPNSAPTVNAGADVTIEATGPDGAPFSLTGSGSDPDNDALTFSWAGGAFGSGEILSGTLPAPAAPSTSQAYTFTLTVSDGKGGEATDEVVVTVTDTTGPVLSNVPAPVVTGVAGGDAAAPYGPVTAFDAVDGNRPVSCLPAAPYPVGDTSVTCTSSDTRGNTTSAPFTVHVPEVTTPGAMEGLAIVRTGGIRYQVGFAVRERATGERARLDLRVTDRERQGRFSARTTDSVAFSDDPTVRPGRSLRPQVDTVLFSGSGEWNGRAGYHYEVCAVDRGDRGFQRDSVRVTITAPDGAVVAHVDGTLTGGFIESERLRR